MTDEQNPYRYYKSKPDHTTVTRGTDGVVSTAMSNHISRGNSRGKGNITTILGTETIAGHYNTIK